MKNIFEVLSKSKLATVQPESLALLKLFMSDADAIGGACGKIWR